MTVGRMGQPPCKELSVRIVRKSLKRGRRETRKSSLDNSGVAKPERQPKIEEGVSVEFTERAEVRKLETSTQRRWWSLDRQFCIIEVTTKAEYTSTKPTARRKTSRRWLAVTVMDTGFERMLGSSCRSKRAAELQCEQA